MQCIEVIVVVFWWFDVFYCFVLLYCGTRCQTTPSTLNNGLNSLNRSYWLVQKYLWGRYIKKLLKSMQENNVFLWRILCMVNSIFNTIDSVRKICAYACACVCITCLLDCRWKLSQCFAPFLCFWKDKGNHQIQWRKCAQMNTYSLFKALCVWLFCSFFFLFLLL